MISPLASRLAGALALAALLAPNDASACSGPIGIPRILTDAEGRVAPGGILLASQYGEVDAITVTDVDGVEHTGTWDELGKSGLGITGLRETYYRWVPEQPLPPGDYEVAGAFSLSGDVLTVHVPDEPAAELELAPTYSLTQRTHGEGSEFACPSDSCALPLHTRTRLAPRVNVSVPETPDWALPRLIARLVAESAGQKIASGFRGAAQLEVEDLETEDGLYFPANAAEYCVTLEVLDVLDGKLHRLDRTCVAGGEPKAEDTPAPFEESGCLGGSELPKGYQAAWCRDNRECADSDAKACEAFAERCADDSPDDGEDGEPEEDGGAADDDDSVGDVGQRGAKGSSCTLSPTPEAVGLEALAMVACAALIARRRR